MTLAPERVLVDPKAVELLERALQESPPVLTPVEQVRTAVYARVSKANKRGETVSVDSQVEKSRQKAEENGWLVTKEYADRAISASRFSTEERVQYQQMLADIRSGIITAVVFWDVDRLIRKPIDLEEFMDLCDRHGVRLAAVTGRVDPATPTGRVNLRLMGLIAAYGSDHTSERILEGMERAAEAGRNHGGPRPYGYVSKSDMTIKPQEAEVVRQVYARLCNGESQSNICRDLNKRNIPSAMDKTWYPNTIKTMLLGPHIAGYRYRVSQRERDAAGGGHPTASPTFAGQGLVPGKWQGILTLEEYRKVRKILIDRSKTRKVGREPSSLLGGQGGMVCQAGHIVDRHMGKGGRRDAYICRMQKYDKPGGVAKDACAGLRIVQEFADDVVGSRVLAYLSLPDNFAALRACLAGEAAPQVERIQQQVEEAQERLTQLGEDVAKHGLPRAVYLPASKRIQKEIDGYLKTLNGIKPASGLPNFQDLHELVAYWNAPDTLMSAKRTLMGLLVEKVELLPAPKVEQPLPDTGDGKGRGQRSRVMYQLNPDRIVIHWHREN